MLLIFHSPFLPFCLRQLENAIRHNNRRSAGRATAWANRKARRMSSHSALMGSRPTIGVHRNGVGRAFAPRPAGTWPAPCKGSPAPLVELGCCLAMTRVTQSHLGDCVTGPNAPQIKLQLSIWDVAWQQGLPFRHELVAINTQFVSVSIASHVDVPRHSDACRGIHHSE